MALCLTNTLSGRKEEFVPLDPSKVTLYVCGVTVYDDCHIGHARGALVFDVLVRYLKFKGYSVTYVRNITDIDDKIIDRARQEGLTPLDLKEQVRSIAGHYTKRFQEDFSHLGLLPPSHQPKATEFIPPMIAFITSLLDRKVAYVGSGGVYFSLREFVRLTPASYGRLSHQSLDELKVGARVEPGEGKNDPLDFALWKKAKPEEPSWPSPWGQGRPGWHIECSTMATILLGDAFDIHGGGQDLIFPHHENEIAQALGAGKGFARLWLHHGLLTVNGQKMSKSLGNFVTIPEALKRHPNPDVLRLFFLSAHYRSPLDFTWEHFDEAARAYERLTDFLAQVEQIGAENPARPSDASREAQEKFVSAMEDDLNTPEALSHLYELVTQAIPWLTEARRGKSVALGSALKDAATTLRSLGTLLGLSFPQEEPDVRLRELVRARDEARGEGDFARADQIRRQVQELGYILEDTSGGTVVRRRV